MGKWNKFNFAKYGIIGLFAGLLIYIVSIFFKNLNIPIFNFQNEFVDFSASVIQIDLRNQIIQAGQYGEWGARVLEFLQGKLSFSLPEFAGIILGTIIVLMVGRTILGFFKINDKIRVGLSFVVGGIFFAIISTIFLGFPFLTSLLSMLAYSLVIGIIMQILVNIKKVDFIKE